MFSGISCVLPCFNESLNIERALETLSSALDWEITERAIISDYEILVVDDGSTDDTARKVCDLAGSNGRIRLLRHPTNEGYGAAVMTGLRAAKLDLVFLADSDNQFDYAEIRQLLPSAVDHDVICGYRALRRDPFMRRMNARAWGFLIRVLFGPLVRDLNCAFKLFRRSALERISLGSVRGRGAFLSVELLVRLKAAGLSIAELPVSHYPRLYGSQTGANPKVIMRAFVELARLYRVLRDEGTLRVSGPGQNIVMLRETAPTDQFPPRLKQVGEGRN